MAYFNGPFGMASALEGRNDPKPRPGAITATDLKAGKDSSAQNKASEDVDV